MEKYLIGYKRTVKDSDNTLNNETGKTGPKHQVKRSKIEAAEPAPTPVTTHSVPSTSALSANQNNNNNLANTSMYTSNNQTSEPVREPVNTKKHTRTWQPKWLQEFPFLIISQDLTTVYCKSCRSSYGPLATVTLPNMYQKYKKGALVHGCKSMKKETWVEHSKSLGHRAAQTFYTAKTKPGVLPADKMKLSMNEDQIQQMSNLYRNAHAVAKKCRPFTDYIWQNELDETKKVKIGQIYRSDKVCKQFIEVISEVERSKIRVLANKAQFISVLSDGSTDVSAIENEIIYIRFSIAGNTYMYFIQLVAVDKADAPGILSAIKQGLSIYDETYEVGLFNKLVAFGADGASVNTGELNGVISLMRKELGPYIILVHCMAHRLELAFKDAFKKIKLFNNLQTLLTNLFAHYKNYLQRANLKKSFEALGQSPVMPTRVTGTRWLSHTETGLKKLLQGYDAFVLHLGQVQSTIPKAKHMLKQLQSKGVIMFAHLLLDILSILASLSSELQRRDIQLHEAVLQVKTSTILIEKLKTKPGIHLSKLMNDQNEFVSTYKETSLTGTTGAFETERETVLKELGQSLTKRYADINTGFLANITISDFKTWPASLGEDFIDFGDEKIENLVTHFKVVLQKSETNPDKILSEWISLKTALYNSGRSIPKLTWVEVNESYGSEFKNILGLMDLLLTLPSSTAECERGFSSMKRIKTEFRNRLKATTVSDLLTIQLIAPDIKEFDPQEAIKLWSSGAKRRFRNVPVVQLIGDQGDLDLEDPSMVNIVGNKDQIQLNKTEAQADDSAADDSDYDSDFNENTDFSDFAESD